MAQIIVLVTRGKHEAVDYAEVVLFEDIEVAEEFCRLHSSGPKKHWTMAEVVREGEEVELGSPNL